MATVNDINGIEFKINLKTKTTKIFQENLSDSVNNFVKYVSLMGIYTYEIFMLMYFGNEVSLSSEELLTSVYESNWMDSSMRYRKLALTLMERLKRKEEMKIAKLFPLNLNMMTSVSVERLRKNANKINIFV